MGDAKVRRSDGTKVRPMSHARARLLAYKTCDGDVTFDELKALSRHLQGCPACRKEAGEIAEFVGMMRRVSRRRRARGGHCNPPPPPRMLPPR